MVSVNTNKLSLLVKKSLNLSTLKLNQAMKKMSTGYKINSAKDNAANYYITNNYSSKISAYKVAEDNTTNGLSYITTSSDNLEIIRNTLARLRTLSEQTLNGTNNKQDITAMNLEANRLIDEIYRIKSSSEYNGQKILGEEKNIGASGLEIKENGFLQDITVRDTSTMTSLSSVNENTNLAVGTYSISSVEELAKLARMQNRGKITNGTEFVLGADIDLSKFVNEAGNNSWVPIGDITLGNGNIPFKGIFDGNGYKIKNLYTDSFSGYRGLFGTIQNAEIKNLAIESGDMSVYRSFNGPIAGLATNSTITNCVSKVNISGNTTGFEDVNGGLLGVVKGNSTIDYCYATGNIKNVNKQVGGLIGKIGESDMSSNVNVTNCFATGDVSANGNAAAGLIGQIKTNPGKIENCFATGDIEASAYASGFIAWCDTATIKNCHSTGNANSHGLGSANEGVSGFLGNTGNNVKLIENCYSTGNATSVGNKNGGFIGAIENSSALKISNCYALGNVHGISGSTGGFAGYIYNSSLTIKDCYASGDVNDLNSVGGFIGQNSSSTLNLTSCYSTGNVHGELNTGGLIGYNNGNSTLANCYSKGNVSGRNYIGGLYGYSGSANTTASNCYVLGKSEGVNGVFTGRGSGSFENCYYSPFYDEKGIDLISGGSATETDSKVYSGVPYSFNENNVFLQVGIDSNSNNQIQAETSFSLENLSDIKTLGIGSQTSLKIIDKLINKADKKQTVLGATQNRLLSALEEISINYENLSSSRSTLRDADISKVSSEYIRQQILQQASATLLATTNQYSSIVLQLL